jgi:ribosomal protein L20A (L18A)
MERQRFTVRMQAETEVVATDEEQAIDKAMEQAGSNLDVDLDSVHIVDVQPMDGPRPDWY